MRVVIADDSKITQDAVRAMLRHLGHEVVGVANDGRQAEALCLDLRPELAILDVHMPGGSGDLAAPQILAMGIRVLMFTSKSAMREAFEAQGIPCLVKPVMVGGLKNKIAEMFPEV